MESALKALACAGPVAVLVALAELRSRWHVAYFASAAVEVVQAV